MTTGSRDLFQRLRDARKERPSASTEPDVFRRMRQEVESEEPNIFRAGGRSFDLDRTSPVFVNGVPQPVPQEQLADQGINDLFGSALEPSRQLELDRRNARDQLFAERGFGDAPELFPFAEQDPETAADIPFSETFERGIQTEGGLSAGDIGKAVATFIPTLVRTEFIEPALLAVTSTFQLDTPKFLEAAEERSLDRGQAVQHAEGLTAFLDSLIAVGGTPGLISTSLFRAVALQVASGRGAPALRAATATLLDATASVAGDTSGSLRRLGSTAPLARTAPKASEILDQQHKLNQATRPIPPQSASARAVDRAFVDDINRWAADEKIIDEIDRVRVPEGAAGPSETYPGRKAGTPIGDSMEQPRRPDIGLEDDLEYPSWERMEQAVLRKWNGARNLESADLRATFRAGEQLLKDKGFNPATLDATEMRPLFEALHGERALQDLPQDLMPIYHDLDALRRLEEADMLAFLNELADQNVSTLRGFDAHNMAERFMAHPEYFPRQWKRESIPVAIANYGRSFGGNGGQFRQRLDLNFIEMLDLGLEPASWNPYSMMARRRIAGVEYRESVKLINRLKVAGKALPATSAPDGFKVPRVGPVFEGRPILTQSGDVVTTPATAVPKDVANVLERLYGRRSDTPGINEIEAFGQALKRLRLTGSFFQHLDFGFRTAAVVGTPTAIRRGSPFKAPSLIFDLFNSSWNPGRREALLNEIISDNVVFRHGGQGITGRMLVEEGWEIAGDLSIINRSLLDALDDPAVRKGLTGDSLRAIQKARKQFEDGLFDGVYRVAQRYALENFILPQVSRVRPNATAIQVAAEAAESVNVMFSTLGTWQTVIKDPTWQRIIRAGMFSANESESLLRGATRAIGVNLSKGGVNRAPQAALFKEFYLGLFVSLSIIANAINFVATGKPLPKEAYVPVRVNDPYAPWKVGYNGAFLSPQMPFIKGRDGQPVYLDIVGQMDTALRWFTDPVGALEARTNILPRAILNQGLGQTFFREKFGEGGAVDNLRDRGIQLGTDLFAPIGAANLTGILRANNETAAGILPAQEPRLGNASAFQALGFNLRSEETTNFKIRAANELGLTQPDGSPITEREHLTPSIENDIRADPRFGAELSSRTQESATRGNVPAQAKVRREEANTKRLGEEEALLGEFLIPPPGSVSLVFNAEEFRDRYGDIQSRYIDSLAQINRDFKQFQDERDLPTDPNDLALVQFYHIYDVARFGSGGINFEEVERLNGLMQSGVGVAGDEVLGQGWTEEQIQFIENNTGLRRHPSGIQRFLDDRELLTPYFEIQDRIIDEQGARDIWQQYLRLNDNGRATMRVANSTVAKTISLLQRAEMEFERDHPDIARLLVVWGYRDKVFNRDVQRQIHDATRELQREVR